MREKILRLLIRMVSRAEVLRLRARFYIMSRLTSRRSDEVEALACLVGQCFHEEIGGPVGVRWAIMGRSGYETSVAGVITHPICWEAPAGITVFVGKPQTPICGLGVELLGNVLSIRQMQGVFGIQTRGGISQWPKFLVYGCMEFAHRHRFVLRLYGADQGMFYYRPDIQTKNIVAYKRERDEHRRRMRRRYDGTARQLGFVKKKRYWEWRSPEARAQ
ncbi:MAG: hypothetical protein KGI70_00125 [Patescibacteria group bacterium]|nr:hypothetical protein [Patescibacteria group bacterium]